MATLTATQRILAAGLGALGAVPVTPAAAAPAPVELAVKATYLVKFLSYVTWPPGTVKPGAPIVLCVIGRDPFGAALDRAAAAQDVGGHGVIIRRAAAGDAAANCHIAFLGGPSRDVARSLTAIGSAPVVTVSDARTSSATGIIHFQLVDDRVRFDIDAAAAAQARITISSKLLALARTVRGSAR